MAGHSKLSKVAFKDRTGEPVMKKKSPLHQIQWHRVVLDESHNIKSDKVGHSQACCALKSFHRWCATGTPFGTSLEDLRGQLAFLKMDPLSNPSLFKRHFDMLRHDAAIEGAGFQLIKALTIRHTKGQKIGGKKLLELPQRSGHLPLTSLFPAGRPNGPGQLAKPTLLFLFRK